MPVDKFGRMKKDDFQAVVEGVSLNYVNKNFIRKGDKIDMGGNSVVNLRDPVHHQDAATMNYVVSTIERIMGDFIQSAAYDGIVTKTYVDDQVSSRKPMITVHAEENGSLSVGNTEWSFGNGVQNRDHNFGYCMPAAGRIIKGTLSAVSQNDAIDAAGQPAGYARVNILKNGIELTDQSIVKEDGEWGGCVSFNPPLELNAGDRINFISKTNNTSVTAAIVSVLVELDV